MMLPFIQDHQDEENPLIRQKERKTRQRESLRAPGQTLTARPVRASRGRSPAYRCRFPYRWEAATGKDHQN